MSARKLSPVEIELLLVCIEGALLSSNFEVDDPETKLIIEAEQCLQKLKVGFDPTVSNRLWNISKDPVLVRDEEYLSWGGGSCIITWFFELMVDKVRETAVKFLARKVNSASLLGNKPPKDAGAIMAIKDHPTTMKALSRFSF